MGCGEPPALPMEVPPMDRALPAPDVVFLLSSDGDRIRFDAATMAPSARGGWQIDRLGAMEERRVQAEQQAVQDHYTRTIQGRAGGDALTGQLLDAGRRLWDLLPPEFRD